MQYKFLPGFLFADFRKASYIDADSVFELVLTRHSHRMTVRRASAAAENLRRIVDATFRIANKTGFAAMSLRDLSRESGLSMGGLYGYIKTKDDLAAMIEDVVRYSSTAIPTWFADWHDPAERLEATLRGHIYLSELLHPWFYFVFMDSRVLSPWQKAVAKSADIHFQQELVQMLRAADLGHGADADLFASHCLNLAQDWYVKRWKYAQMRVKVDDFADSVCAMIRRAAIVREDAR